MNKDDKGFYVHINDSSSEYQLTVTLEEKEVKENQKVVDTGLYAIVRHPMYFATLFLFLSMPFILNSPISFLIMLSYIPIIVKRMKNEEEVLEKELDGYIEYKKKVKYRLLPFIY